MQIFKLLKKEKLLPLERDCKVIALKGIAESGDENRWKMWPCLDCTHCHCSAPSPIATLPLRNMLVP